MIKITFHLFRIFLNNVLPEAGFLEKYIYQKPLRFFKALVAQGINKNGEK